MNKSEKIKAIAQHLAERVKDDKRPYSQLKWIVEYCSHQYKATQSELWESYFAAINILKAEDVETGTKRKPLTNLTKKERAHIRKVARRVAGMLSQHLGIECKVTRLPIRVTESDGGMTLQIAIYFNHYSEGYVYPTVKQLQDFEAMDEVNQASFMYKYAQQFFGWDDKVSRDIDTLKTQLEALL